MKQLPLSPGVNFLIGENGCGKSTLMEAIAVAVGLNAEGGSRHFNFSTRATHSNLHEFLRIVRGTRRPRDSYFLRAESFYNVASAVDDNADALESHGGRSLHEQSHGESFLALLTNRFKGSGLYLLDEPEAALSPARQLSALRVIHDLACAGSQFIIATHSPILMSYPGSSIFLLSNRGIKRVEYEETEHYQLSQLFFTQREKILRELFEDENNASENHTTKDVTG